MSAPKKTTTITEDWRIRRTCATADCGKEKEVADAGRRKQQHHPICSVPLVVQRADSVYCGGTCDWYRGDGAMDAARRFVSETHPNGKLSILNEDGDDYENVAYDCYADDDRGQCWHLIVSKR